MNLYYRYAREHDFDGVLRVHSRFRGATEDYNADIRYIWKAVFPCSSATICVVMDKDRTEAHQIIGICGCVFVSDEFVTSLKTDMPLLNDFTCLPPMLGGCSPCISSEQTRFNNSGDGINCYMIEQCYDPHNLTSNEALQLRGFLTCLTYQMYRGYHIKELLSVTHDGILLQRMLNMGASIRREIIVEHMKKLYVIGFSRDDVVNKEGSYLSQVLMHTQPILELSPRLQDMLELAVNGRSDDEIACILNISTHAVKKRWSTIYAKTRVILPGLLPADSTDGVRGQEKRAILMQYISTHPQEYRPYLPGFKIKKYGYPSKNSG